MACTPLIVGDANPARSASQATPVRQSSTAPAKTTTIQVRGTSQTVPLGLLQTRDFSTYFPTDRFTISASTPATLQWKKPDGTLDKDTFIGIIYYGKDMKLSDVREITEVYTQLYASKEGRKITQSPAIDAAKKAYSTWLRDMFQFEIKPENGAERGNRTFNVYLGEVNNQVFVVGATYDVRDEAEFTPREAVILKSLRIAKTNKTQHNRSDRF